LAGPTLSGRLLGGPGADLLTSGGPNPDATTSYEDHDARGVRVTLDGMPNDGAPGEGDDVRTSNVFGSPGPDVIVGDDGANKLAGSLGADRIDGDGGDDVIEATLQGAPGTDGADRVTCGAGNDVAMIDNDDTAAIDCERILAGQTGGPEVAYDL